MSDAIVTALTAVARLPDFFRSMRADSLVKYTSVTRVEPVTLVDSKAVHLPYTHDVLQTLNSIFAAYYLQAVAISVNVGKIDVVRLLDKVNPNRNPAENAGMFIGDFISAESYKHALPVPGQAYGLEAYGDVPNVTGSKLDRENIKQITEVSNLSVGKLLNVEITQDKHTAVIPVSIRLIVSAIGSDNLTQILSVGSKDTSVKERYHGWRSGQLEFIKDTILCQDLIDSHRKALMGDKSGVYQQTLDRNKRNKLSAILSGAPSIATASNLMVMTTDTARAVEAAGGGRLKDFKFRQNMFKNTYIMLMVVIDPSFEQVTIYTRDIEMPVTVSVKEIKNSNKSGGPDVAEILKAYQLGHSPSI